MKPGFLKQTLPNQEERLPKHTILQD